MQMTLKRNFYGMEEATIEQVSQLGLADLQKGVHWVGECARTAIVLPLRQRRWQLCVCVCVLFVLMLPTWQESIGGQCEECAQLQKTAASGGAIGQRYSAPNRQVCKHNAKTSALMTPGDLTSKSRCCRFVCFSQCFVARKQAGGEIPQKIVYASLHHMWLLITICFLERNQLAKNNCQPATTNK